jgi:tetratricopeptide (TPR) repeat protein
MQFSHVGSIQTACLAASMLLDENSLKTMLPPQPGPYAPRTLLWPGPFLYWRDAMKTCSHTQRPSRRNALFILGVFLLTGLLAGGVFARDADAGILDKAFLTASLNRGVLNEESSRIVSPEKDRARVMEYNDRGVDYSQKGDYDLALEEFDKALAIDQRSAEIYNNRGITYSKKGAYDRAMADFKKALEIKPESAEFNYNLGITYAKKGQLELGLSKVNKAIEINPSDAFVYTTRARMYMDLACSDWKRACDSGN